MPNPKINPDAIAKQNALNDELQWARRELHLETLETRNMDSLDFHEISVGSIRALVRHALETGYRVGLHAGYRQGRGDATREVDGRDAPSSPRNPELKTGPTT
jgi:hypothetical protein